MRIGLFGGTFNPVHLGHLRAAEEVQEAFKLERVYFIPCALPPHKANADLAPASARQEMLHVALAEVPYGHVSDVELNRPGLSYTIDTIKHFRADTAAGIALFLIIGYDAFIEIDTWKAYRELFEQTAFIVLPRVRTDGVSSEQLRRRIETFLTSKVSAQYRLQRQPDRMVYDAADCHPVIWYDAPVLKISSTRIRRLRRSGRSIRFLVPAAVEQIILAKGLYL
jgi:nicotinate-nucleotide adenylyltransferase